MRVLDLKSAELKGFSSNGAAKNLRSFLVSGHFPSVGSRESQLLLETDNERLAW